MIAIGAGALIIGTQNSMDVFSWNLQTAGKCIGAKTTAYSGNYSMQLVNLEQAFTNENVVQFPKVASH